MASVAAGRQVSRRKVLVGLAGTVACPAFASSGAMAQAAASLEAMALFRGVGSRPGGMREHAFVA